MVTLFLTYELKVAVLIAVFYIFWRLLVANETWHRLNRIVLLSTAVASFVLPLCVITIHQTIEVAPAATDTMTTALPMDDLPILSEASSVTVAPETEKPFNWQLPLTFIYIIGVVVVLSKMLLSLWRLHKMKAESEIHPLADGRQIAVCDKAKTPFSWWKTVFLNHQDFEEGTSALLTHELGHLQMHHSVDVLLVELLTALQWFNPAMWMLRADLRTIHEYEADQQVISHGFNDIQYLQLLIRKAAGQSGYSLANGISNSALKKRVTMIMKSKSNHRQWLRYAYLLPIVVVSLAMSARIQKDEVLNPSVMTNDVTESLTDDNRLILLIDDLDDLKKIVAEKRITRKMKANLDFNDHFTQKGMNGKTIIVHLPQGTIYENDKGSKKVESDLDYAFPKNGFEWKLNGMPFNENNIPTLHFKALKKVENHWNGKKNVVNLITMGSQSSGEVVVVAEAPTTSEPADDKPFIAKGFVYDSDEDKSTPIVGAVILIDGTKKGTVTDREGKFQIEVSMGDNITASYVGYESKTIGVSKAYSESSKSNEYYIGLHKESESVDPGKIYDVVEDMPQFPGGPGALFEYISKSLKYPAEAEKAGTQGRVIATFVVEKDGSITNAKVVKAIDPLLDAEALRIIHEMPKWIPGKQNGELMRVKYTIPITFRLQGNNDDARQYSGTVKIDKTKRVHQSVETVVVGDEAEKEPYVVVDGKPIDGAKLKEIDPKTIEHMEVLKSKVAIEKYGEKAKNGVIVITIKKK